ncbi:hypothetical protein D3C85_238860 [compost metagenome]
MTALELRFLRIPARPTEGPQPWPEELDGFTPDFTNLNTYRYGHYYGVKKPGRLAAENTHQLRPFTLDLINGVVSFTIEDDYTPFTMQGCDLIITLDLNARTYVVTLGDNHSFDEEDYLELDEDDRTVAVFGFEGAFKDESERA